MGEVNSIWPDIRRQIDDPFLVCVPYLQPTDLSIKLKGLFYTLHTSS